MLRSLLKSILVGVALLCIIAVPSLAQVRYLRTIPDQPVLKNIYDMSFDSLGNLWITSEGALTRISADGTWKHIVDGVKPDGYQGLCIGPDNTVYFRCVDRLYRVPFGTDSVELLHEVPYGRGNDWSSNIVVDKDSYVYYSRNGNLYKIAPDKSHVLHMTGVPYIESPSFDQDGNLWYTCFYDPWTTAVGRTTPYGIHTTFLLPINRPVDLRVTRANQVIVIGESGNRYIFDGEKFVVSGNVAGEQIGPHGFTNFDYDSNGVAALAHANGIFHLKLSGTAYYGTGDYGGRRLFNRIGNPAQIRWYDNHLVVNSTTMDYVRLDIVPTAPLETTVRYAYADGNWGWLDNNNALAISRNGDIAFQVAPWRQASWNSFLFEVPWGLEGQLAGNLGNVNWDYMRLLHRGSQMWATAMEYDRFGNLWILGHGGLTKITSDGKATHTTFPWGSGKLRFDRDGRMHASRWGATVVVRQIDGSWNPIDGFWPYSFTIDDVGNYYAYEGSHVRLVRRDGTSETFGSVGTRPGQFSVNDWNLPFDLALDFQGHLYTADYSASRIHVWEVPNPIAPAPSTAYTTVPESNANLWANTDVFVKMVAESSRSGVGVREIHYSIAGAPESTIPGKTASFPIYSEGEIPFEYYAVGNDGVVEAKKQGLARVDKTAPQIDSTFDGNTISLSASDSLSGVDYIQYEIDKYGVATIDASSTQFGVNAGTARVRFWAYDMAGNKSAEKVVVVTKYLKSVTVEPEGQTANVIGGKKADVVVTLAEPAPPGGLDVTLASSRPDLFPVPEMVTVPHGHTGVRVTVQAAVPAGATQIGLTAKQDTVETSTAFWIVNLEVSQIALPITFERQKVTGRLHFSTPVPDGGAVIQLTSSNPQVVSVPASVNAAAGATFVDFLADYGSVDNHTTVAVTANVDGYARSGEAVVIDRRVTGLSISPSTVVGGNAVAVSVGIGAPAPPTGVVINLTSNNPALPLPATAKILAGQNGIVLNIVTRHVPADVVVTASAQWEGNGVEQTVNIGRNRIAGFHATPAEVVGGWPSKLTVELSAPAPAGGTVIPLQSDNPVVKSPATITVPAGKKIGIAALESGFVSTPTTGKVTATYNGDSPTAQLIVQPNGLVSFDATPATMKGGLTGEGVITITTSAPPGGRKVAVSSSNPAIVVPATVTIAAGTKAAGFKIQSSPVAQETVVTITVSIDGTTLSEQVTLTAASPLTSVTVLPSRFDSGTAVTIKVAKKATTTPVAKITVSGVFGTLEKTDVPGGATSVLFENVVINGDPGTGTVNAECLGATISGTYTINALALSGFTLDSANVFERRSALGTLTLNSPAPVGGVTVTLASSRPELPVPSTVTIPAGSRTATFTVNAGSVTADVSAVLTATGPGTSKTVSAKVVNIVKTVSATPTSALVGASVTVQVTKAATPFPLGRLEVEMPDGTVVAKENVPGNTTAVSFGTLVVTGPAGAKALKATFEGETVNGSFSAVANTIASLAVSPNIVDETQSATATVTLTHPAAVGGTTVALSSGNPAIQVPASVVVPEGATQATFTVGTSATAATVKSTVSATLNGKTVSAAMTVRNITVATKTTVLFQPAKASYPRGTTISVQAKLATTAGVALPGRTIVFRRFLNLTQSPVIIGTASTNASGIATINYTIPTDPSQIDIVVEATYDGNPDPVRNGASKGTKRIPIGL